MTTWFTADTHFGHAKIIEYCRRPFRSVDHMNDEIARRWCSVVEPGDTVYVLGDACLGDIQRSLGVMEELPGWKILVPGNHDRVFLGSTAKMSEEKRRLWEGRYLAAFDEIRHSSPTTSAVTYPLGPDGEDAVLSHFPHYHTGSPRDLMWLLPHTFEPGDPRWLIHGHVHTEYKVWREERSVNVGVDQWNFTPVSEEELRLVIGEWNE